MYVCVCLCVFVCIYLPSASLKATAALSISSFFVAAASFSPSDFLHSIKGDASAIELTEFSSCCSRGSCLVCAVSSSASCFVSADNGDPTSDEV